VGQNGRGQGLPPELVESDQVASSCQGGLMWLPFCSEADPLGNGARSIDQEAVYSDMTDWRRFGRAPDFSEERLRT